MTRRSFLRSLMAVVVAPLLVPAVKPRRPEVSVLFLRHFDITADTAPCRIDVLYGWATVRPELACRVLA